MNRSLLVAVLMVVLLISTGCPKPLSVNDVYHAQADTLIDEAAHFKNSLEWWYFTGHLEDTLTKDQYGIEYVFFHFNPRDKSDYMMGNVALSDPQKQRFTYDYKIIKRDSLLTPVLPLELQINSGKQNWELQGQHGSYHLKAQMRRHPGFGVDLTTTPGSGAWLHGGGSGYQRYGKYAEAGYYSYPELAAEGLLFIDGNPKYVRGNLWYDRQWNCIGVYQKEVAWDWMAIQLDGGEELMVFKLYHRGDQKVIYGGSFRNAQGQSQTLGTQDIIIEELAYWKSPKSKVEYPVDWLVKVPALDLSLNVQARFPEQELSLKFAALVSLHYWEGMSTVRGTHERDTVNGRAYVELTNRKWIKNE